MALDKDTFKADFVTLMTDMRTREAVSDAEFAERFVNMIEVFVKSGDGIYQAGTLKAGATVVTAAPTTIVKIN